MRVPFGKYKNWMLKDVPTDYIEWCIGNFEWKSPNWKRWFEEEMLKRMSEEQELEEDFSRIDDDIYNADSKDDR